ncbi:flagellar basal body-associated FliL family protein [Niveispirillum sp. KHB5.9]|uniref:flagellar basal body-associated FliL family protein n=1 Tax=Niveispirillum sp. KHB5.9 TaxID=3400269 RepID=UPI003A84598C
MTDSTFDRLEKRLPPPGPNTRKHLYIIAGVFIIGLGAGLIAGRMQTQDAVDEVAAAAAAAASADRFVVLPELTVNLRSTATVKLMKIGVTLRTVPDQRQKLAELEPLLVDEMQQYLRALDENDLEGRLGVETLRAELLRRVRTIAGPVPVDAVLLRTLILQ